MFFYISASSKDKKVLKKFSSFLYKLEASTLTLKYFSRQKKRKFITILKSPHVNKTAQEQFEYRFYKKQFLISSFKPLTFLFFLKKIKNVSFSGLNLQVKGIASLKGKNMQLLKLVNPDNFVLNERSKNLRNVSFLTDDSLKEYIRLFDCYGELYLQKKHYI